MAKISGTLLNSYEIVQVFTNSPGISGKHLDRQRQSNQIIFLFCKTGRGKESN
jgi:hypothetical protein